jgi:hypothetical protein
MLPLLLLWVAAATRVELVDQVFEIPAGEWRYVELHVRQQPVTVVCHFDTVDAGAVRLALLRRGDLERLREERPHGVAAATSRDTHGSLRYVVRSPGGYAVVVDNRGDAERSARVHLRVALDFAGHTGAAVRTLSPLRQAVVVAISFAVFFAIVLCAGRKLLRGARR